MLFKRGRVIVGGSIKDDDFVGVTRAALGGVGSSLSAEGASGSLIDGVEKRVMSRTRTRIKDPGMEEEIIASNEPHDDGPRC